MGNTLKHRVSFLEWIRTGQFGPIRVGMPTLEVYEALGYPDDTRELAGVACVGKKRCRYPAGIGLSDTGDVQLMFSHPEHRLSMIQVDYVGECSDLDGGVVFDLDLWAIQPGASYVQLIEQCKVAGIQGQHFFPKWAEGDGTARLDIGAGVELLLILEQEGTTHRLGPNSIYQLHHPGERPSPEGYPSRKSIRAPRRF